MIYIYDENIAKYDALENKSEFINNLLKDLPAVHVEPDENQISIDEAFEEKIRKLRNNG